MAQFAPSLPTERRQIRSVSQEWFVGGRVFIHSPVRP